MNDTARRSKTIGHSAMGQESKVRPLDREPRVVGLHQGQRTQSAPTGRTYDRRPPAVQRRNKNAIRRPLTKVIASLRRQPQRPNFLKKTPKILFRRKAHGSISVQEGQPVIVGYLRKAIKLNDFRDRRSPARSGERAVYTSPHTKLYPKRATFKTHGCTRCATSEGSACEPRCRTSVGPLHAPPSGPPKEPPRGCGKSLNWE